MSVLVQHQYSSATFQRKSHSGAPFEDSINFMIFFPQIYCLHEAFSSWLVTANQDSQ